MVLKRMPLKASVIFFYFFSLFLGIDFGYMSSLNKNTKTLLMRCAFVLMTVVNIIISGLPFLIPNDNLANAYENVYASKFAKLAKYTQLWWSAGVGIQYITGVGILLSTKYTFFKFMQDLKSINKQFISQTSGFMEVLLLLYVLMMLILRGGFSLLICTEIPCEFYMYLYSFIGHLPTVGIDLILFELFLIYYYAYKIIKHTNYLMKHSAIDYKTVCVSYVKLATCLERLRTRYDVTLTIELLVDLPKLVGMIWTSLVLIQYHASLPLYLIAYIFVVNIIVQIVLPALMVTKVKSQVESLAIYLQEQLLLQQDTQEIVNLLRYVRARPLYHKLWRVFPTDLRLPLSLFNLCFTYFIVTVQFTHLYD